MRREVIVVPTGAMSEGDWLAYRYTGVGASETGTVLGLDDYKSSLELYYEKIGDTPRVDVMSMAAFMGHRLEDLVARMWMHWDGDEASLVRNWREGHVVRRCRRIRAYVRNPKYPWLFASLDRLINRHDGRPEGALELKTIGGWEADKWEAGLPPKYVTQVQQQLVCGMLPYGEMAILEDGRRFNVLPFEYHKSIAEELITRTHDFWRRVERGRQLVTGRHEAMRTFDQRRVEDLNAEIDALAPEPDGTLIYDAYLRKRHNDPSLAMRRGTEAERELAVQHRTATAALKDQQAAVLRYEGALKRALSDHQILDFGPDGRVTWVRTRAGTRVFRNQLNTIPS